MRANRAACRIRSIGLSAATVTAVVLAPATAAYAAPPAAGVNAFGHQRCTIVGTDGNDVITGTPGNDTICAGPGDDVINGGGGSDTIYGDAGNDVITGSNGTKSSFTGGAIIGGDDIQGGPGNDTIRGLGGDDILEGNGGNDKIWAGSGADLVYGDNSPGEKGTATGNDVIYGGSGDDSLSGGPGNDQLYAGSNTVLDQVSGDAGNDLLVGSGPTNTDDFDGGDGNDILIPDPLRTSPLGNDVDGGDGNDVIVTLNGMFDVYSTGSDVSVPVSDSCSVKVAPAKDSAGNWSWTIECQLPFGGKTTDIDFGEDSSGNITGSATLANNMLSLSVSSWQKLLNGSANSLEADTVLADPPAPPFSGDEDVG